MAGKKKSTWALDFGRRLSDRRRELGLTQQDVADAAGIHRTLLADYERDNAPERVPTDDTLRGLAEALSVPEQMMYDWAGVRLPKVDMSISPNTPPELLDKLSSLEDAVRMLTERLEGLGSNGTPVKRPRRRPPA